MQRLFDCQPSGTTGGRALLAFLVAPFYSSIVITIIGVSVWFAQMPSGENPPNALWMLVMFVVTVIWGWIVMGAPFSYMGMVVLGIPAYLLLRFTNTESGFAYSLIGAVGGYWLSPELGGNKWDHFPLDLLGATGGAISGVIFWHIAQRQSYGWE